MTEAAIPVTGTVTGGLGEVLTCGYERRAAVTRSCEAPFAFTGTLHQVIVDVDLNA